MNSFVPAFTYVSNKKRLLAALLLFLASAFTALHAQAVTEVITDYGGYWKSSNASVNPVKPDNSHSLLAFVFNGTRYSTGVNDALLGTHGESYISGDFRALPVSAITGTVTANTKIGLGALYDGVASGPSSPAPANNIPFYLTDGTKGLNLGTGAANLPAGSMTFTVNNLQLGAVGDGKPDILVTQIADPSSTLDTYEFTDVNGVRIGNSVDISFSAIASVGNWTVDFYEASQNPMILAAGFTQTDRPLRLWAADFSTFGINAGNYHSIAYFKITLGGNSDLAFVAYNFTAITVLPVRLSFFKAAADGTKVDLSWQTSSEINTSRFVIEHSTDGIHFTALDSIPTAGVTGTVQNYSFQHQPASDGLHYYRLKMVDLDGKFSYSPVVHTFLRRADPLDIKYLSNNRILVSCPVADGPASLQLLNMEGRLVMVKELQPGVLSASLDLQRVPKGVYQLLYLTKQSRAAHSILVY
jgi:hypothetical protein